VLALVILALGRPGATLVSFRSLAREDGATSTASTKGNGTIELVISACREPTSRIAKLSQLASGLRAALPGSAFGAVEVRVYCKCGMFPWCTQALDNVGREGHTFLTHMARRYDELADVTIFLNAGPGTIGTRPFVWKAKALTTIMQSVHRDLGRQRLSNTYYCDKTTTLAKGWVNATARATSERAYAARLAACSVQLEIKCAQDSESRCTILKRYDVIEGLCTPNTSRCECDGPTGCYWLGTTAANVAYMTEPGGVDTRGILAPARPAAFAQWACEHFGILPDAWHACRWVPFGMFAVGSARIRAHAHAEYERAADELASAGSNGGVAVHFMERLYRSIFLCSLDDIGLGL
jgi:hypothetical protein